MLFLLRCLIFFSLMLEIVEIQFLYAMADNIPNKCNLIVNYLPQTLTDLQFHELFESVGKTTYTRIIRDKMSSYR